MSIVRICLLLRRVSYTHLILFIVSRAPRADPNDVYSAVFLLAHILSVSYSPFVGYCAVGY